MTEPIDLVKYLEVFQSDNFGEWVTHPGHLGTSDDPIPIPHVDYSDAVLDFEQAVYTMADVHPEYNLRRYRDVLEKNGLDWGAESLSGADVSESDMELILAMIMGIFRADRFSEGIVLSFLRNGHIQRWLERLAEIDLHT